MRIAILGCGYVGLALAEQLVADHQVVGVRRSADGAEAVAATGATAVRADVTDGSSLEAVPDADALVFAASTGGRGAQAAREVYVEGLATAIDHFASRENPPERLVYTSSTGVYGDHGGDWVTEETPVEPTTEKTQVLVRAEEIARDRTRERGIEGIVARFAGLYGPDRYRLERYLAGPVTEGYLNMIHRTDAAGAVRFLIEHDRPPEVVLVVDDEPVQRWAFADWLAGECGRDAPPKVTVEERLEQGDLSDAARRRLRTEKRCSNDRLRGLGYVLRFPTYREGYRAAVASFRAGDGGR